MTAVDERCPHCGYAVAPLQQTCGQCGKGLSGAALLAPSVVASTQRRSKRSVARGFWVISLLATGIGGFVAFLGISGASGAPQQAAAAAIALVIVIVPYVFARAVEEIVRD